MVGIIEARFAGWFLATAQRMTKMLPNMQLGVQSERYSMATGTSLVDVGMQLERLVPKMES